MSIFLYHRILPGPDEIFPSEIDADSFDSQLSVFKKIFNILPLEAAVEKLKSGSLPERAACITFDDGYADNAEIALPILQRHRLHSTFFIATAYLNGGRMFNDTIIHAIRHCQEREIDLSRLGLSHYDLGSNESKRQAIGRILSHIKYLPLGQREDVAEEVCALATDVPPPSDLMLTNDQLRFLRDSGMGIGGHTSRHPILAKLDVRHAYSEIEEGKAYLESNLGIKVRLFAYPNGKPNLDYSLEQVSLPRSLGFEAAVSTQIGAAHMNSDFFQLPRFTVYKNNMSRLQVALLANLFRKYEYA